MKELLTFRVDVGPAVIDNADLFRCGTNFLPLFLTQKVIEKSCLGSFLEHGGILATDKYVLA